MSSATEPSRTDTKERKGALSIVFGFVKMAWRFIRGVFRLVFGRVGLALLAIVLLADFFLETHGLPKKALDRILKPSENGVLLKCEQLKVGLFNGIVLHHVLFDANTVAGPLVVHARRISAQMNWLGVFGEDGWIPNAAQAIGVKLELLGSDHNTVMSCKINEGTLSFEGDDQLLLILKGEGLGIRMNVTGRFEHARDFISQLATPGEPVKPNPKISKMVEDISSQLHTFGRLSDDSFIDLDLSADCRKWEEARGECNFSMSDLLVNGVVVSKFRGHLKGGMESLAFDDLSVILSRSEVFNGHGVFYPKSMEIEAEVDGELAPATACQLARVETKDWLTHRIRIPSLSFKGSLPKGPLEWRGMRPELTCSLKTSFEAFGVSVEKGRFQLACQGQKLIVKDFSLVLSKDGRESIHGQVSLDIDSMTATGSVDGRIAWMERLNDYGVFLPSEILSSNGSPADFHIDLATASVDWRELDVAGWLKDDGLHFLTQPCRRMEMSFSMRNGLFSIEQMALNLRGIEEAVSMNLSCNLLEGMKEGGAFETEFHLEALARPEVKSKWEKGLSCGGMVRYRPEGRKLAVICEKSYCHPDWIYQTYCRRLDLSASFAFVRFGTTDSPVEFTLEMPEFSLDNMEGWQVSVKGVHGNNCKFGLDEWQKPTEGQDRSYSTFIAKEVGCDVLVTGKAVEITNITATTIDDEQLRLDIRVQYSPLEFSIKDLELEGNPALAEAFILNTAAQDTYRSIWSDIEWRGKAKPMLRMPTLIYKDGSPWSLTLTGHINAEDVHYRGYVADELNLVVELNLPSSLSIKPITLKTHDGDIYGELAFSFGGVTQCTFKVDCEEGYLNPKTLLMTVSKDFGDYLSSISFSDKTRLSFAGDISLGADPRLSIHNGFLSCPEITWTHKSQSKRGEETEQKFVFSDVESLWSYSSNGVSWDVRKASFLGGAIRTHGVYEPEHKRGEALVFINDLPFKRVAEMAGMTSPSVKQKKEITGVVNGECHGRFLQGWAGRPLHLEGDGHLTITEGDLWNVPLLEQLAALLPGSNDSVSTLGSITQLDADIEFLGTRLYVPNLRTNGTIMALRANGEYNLESERLKFLVSGVPLQEVGILSLALRPLTWAFQAELEGTRTSHKWRMQSGLMKLFNY